MILAAFAGTLSQDPPIPDIRYCLVPKSDVKVVDDWYVLGPALRFGATGTVFGKNSPMRFEHAKLDGVKFIDASLPPAARARVDFSNATMNDVTFDEAFFALYCCGSVIDLTGAVLTNVNVTIKGKNFPIDTVDTVGLGNVVLCRTRVVATNGGTPLEVFDDKVVSRDCKK